MNTTDQATPRPHGPFFDVGCHVLKGGFRVAECHTPLAATQITDAMNAYDRLQREHDEVGAFIKAWEAGATSVPYWLDRIKEVRGE